MQQQSALEREVIEVRAKGKTGEVAVWVRLNHRRQPVVNHEAAAHVRTTQKLLVARVQLEANALDDEVGLNEAASREVHPALLKATGITDHRARDLEEVRHEVHVGHRDSVAVGQEAALCPHFRRCGARDGVHLTPHPNSGGATALRMRQGVVVVRANVVQVIHQLGADDAVTAT